MDERHVRLILDGDKVAEVKPAKPEEKETQPAKDQQSSSQNQNRET